MARVFAKYVLAALLALLSTQAATVAYVPRGAAAIEWRADAELRAVPSADRNIPRAVTIPDPLPYASRRRPEPDTRARFQRPPPAILLSA